MKNELDDLKYRSYTLNQNRYNYNLIDIEDEEKLFDDVFNWFKKSVGNILTEEPKKRIKDWFVKYFETEDGIHCQFLYNPYTGKSNIVVKNKPICKYSTGIELDLLLRRYKSQYGHFSGPYPELAIKLGMEEENVYREGFHALYSRHSMSYSNNFAYSDIFKRNSTLINYMKNDLKVDVCPVAAFVYRENYDILLLVGQGSFNFLTTVEMLADDLNVSPNEIRNRILRRLS